jgi:hypothetical protein
MKNIMRGVGVGMGDAVCVGTRGVCLCLMGGGGGGGYRRGYK